MAKKRVTVDAEAMEQRQKPNALIIDSIKILNGDEGAKRHIIRYQDGQDKKTLDSPEPAADSLYKTFQSLLDDGMDILELPEEYRFNAQVKTLNLKYEGSALNVKAQIGMTKDLSNTKGSCHLMTPYKFVGSPTTSQTDSEPKSNEGAEFTVHTTAAARRIRSMIDHAVNYLEGKRAAMTLEEQE